MNANSSWRGERVLVTGATGLIGSWLCRRLNEVGAEVVALVQDNDALTELSRSGTLGACRIVNGELEDYGAIERAIHREETATVFHLGAQTLVGAARRAPHATFEANIRGTYNLLEAIRRSAGVVRRAVIASSDKAYGTQATLPYTEDTPLQGLDPYSASKSCTDLITQSYASTYGLPINIARCGNVYGGGDLNWSRIVPGTIRSLLHREAPILRSDGTYIRDYIFVDDVVDGYLAIADGIDRGVCGEAFNISTEEALTVLNLVTTIRSMMDCDDIPFDIQATASHEIHDQHLSAAKARAVLGWEPRFGLQRGLAETIAWYREYLTTTSN